MLKVLYLTLMLPGRLQRVKCTEVLTLMCLCIYLAAVDAVLSGFQFAYHDVYFYIKAVSQSMCPMRIAHAEALLILFYFMGKVSYGNKRG